MNDDVTGYKELDACTFSDNYAELKRTLIQNIVIGTKDLNLQ